MTKEKEEADFLAHDVDLSSTHDPIVLVANLRTGAIKEIPCGPRNSSHINGDRPLVWSKVDAAARVPKHYRDRFMRYDELCRSAEKNEEHGLSKEDGDEYFVSYARFVIKRGRGKSVRPGMEAPKLHPALQRRPNGISAKSTADTKTIDERLAELERRAKENEKAADARAEEATSKARAALIAQGMTADEVDKVFA